MTSLPKKVATLALGTALCLGVGFAGASSAEAAECTPGTSTIAQCFPDATLAGAVAGALGAANTDATFTAENASVANLDLSNKGLTTIDGLQAFNPLLQVNLSGNNLTDITPLAGKNLVSLNLQGNANLTNDVTAGDNANANALNAMSGLAGLITTGTQLSLDPSNPNLITDPDPSNSVTLTINLNGGYMLASDGTTHQTGTITRAVTKGESFQQRNSLPQRDGAWSFSHFTTDEAGQNAFDINTPLNEDVTLYAQWNADSATVDPAVAGGAGAARAAEADPAAGKLASTGSSVLPVAFATVLFAVIAGVCLSVVASKRRN